MKELQGVGNTFEPNVVQMVVHEVMSYIKQYASPLMQKWFDTNPTCFPSVEISQIQKLTDILPNFRDVLRLPSQDSTEELFITTASHSPRSR